MSESMVIPDGLVCGDCKFYRTCGSVIGMAADSTECDFYPVRFVLDNRFALLRAEVASLAAERDALKAEVERLRDAQRWIPVGERLPEEEGHYIVSVNRGVSRSPIDWNHRDVYECVYTAFAGWHTANDVTHWQPLPAAPTSEQEQE